MPESRHKPDQFLWRLLRLPFCFTKLPQVAHTSTFTMYSETLNDVLFEIKTNIFTVSKVIVLCQYFHKNNHQLILCLQISS